MVVFILINVLVKMMKSGNLLCGNIFPNLAQGTQRGESVVVALGGHSGSLVDGLFRRLVVVVGGCT